jgi:hypothetical protein
VKILVCGGREYADKDFLYNYLDGFRQTWEWGEVKLTHLIHGDARGADALAHGWAVQTGIQPVKCPAMWLLYGPKAGAIRNARMLALLDLERDFVIAFQGGAGTAHMMSIARKARVRVIDTNQGARNERIRNDHEGSG